MITPFGAMPAPPLRTDVLTELSRAVFLASVSIALLADPQGL